MSQNISLEQGLEHFDKKEYEKAEVKFRMVLDSQETDDMEITFRLAFCLEMQGKYEEAESLYYQVEASDVPPAIAGDALYRIAWMAMVLKDHEKAITYYKKASEILKVSQNPDSHRIYNDSIFWMALSYEVLGQIYKALNIYAQIANDDFWFWDVCHRKIKCFDKIGRYEDVLTCCREFEDHYGAAGDVKRAKELYPEIKTVKEQLEKLLLDGE